VSYLLRSWKSTGIAVNLLYVIYVCEYPNDIGAGRIKLTAIPVDFQDLRRYDTTDDIKLRDRKSAPLSRGYMLIDRVGFEHKPYPDRQGRV